MLASTQQDIDNFEPSRFGNATKSNDRKVAEITICDALGVKVQGRLTDASRRLSAAVTWSAMPSYQAAIIKPVPVPASSAAKMLTMNICADTPAHIRALFVRLCFFRLFLYSPLFR